MSPPRKLTRLASLWGTAKPPRLRLDPSPTAAVSRPDPTACPAVAFSRQATRPVAAGERKPPPRPAPSDRLCARLSLSPVLSLRPGDLVDQVALFALTRHARRGRPVVAEVADNTSRAYGAPALRRDPRRPSTPRSDRRLATRLENRPKVARPRPCLDVVAPSPQHADTDGRPSSRRKARP